MITPAALCICRHLCCLTVFSNPISGNSFLRAVQAAAPVKPAELQWEQSPKQTLSAQEVKQEGSDVFKKVTKNELNCRKQLCFSSQNSLPPNALAHSNPQKPIPQQIYKLYPSRKDNNRKQAPRNLK